MVRFIIRHEVQKTLYYLLIYIPIWLDLLLHTKNKKNKKIFYLHSNMVRFIIGKATSDFEQPSTFTFQYGQIYYMIKYFFSPVLQSFTFQYGQIYYFIFIRFVICNVVIYIPIWLDLLSKILFCNSFINPKFTFQYGQIYYHNASDG